MSEKNKRLSDDDEIDLLDLAKYLYRYLLWILLGGMIGAVILALGTKILVHPEYKATTTMYVYSQNEAQGNITNSDIQTAQNLLGTYQAILESDTVLEAAIEKLGDSSMSSEELRNMITIEIPEDTQVLSIGVTSEDPQQAQNIAETIASVAPKEIVRITKAGSVEIVDHAKLPEDAINNNLLRNTALGFLMGILLLAGVLVIKKFTSNKVFSAFDIEKILDIPVIGEIPLMDSKSENSEWDIYEGGRLLYEEKNKK